MDIRLMSSNIWGDYFGNEVEGRDRLLVGVYRKYLPDVLGLQEMTQSWKNSPIWMELKDEYQFVPVSTGGKHNFIPMLYRYKKLQVIDSGWKMYHEELDSSKGYIWAVFRTEDNKVLAVFNTHFMWRENELSYDVIRRYNAMELDYMMREVSQVYGGIPVFFMGDLNAKCDSLAWKYFNETGWVTSFSLTKECSEFCSWRGDPQRGADNCFHGKMTDAPKEDSLDHIGMRTDTKILRQVTITDQEALDASDHSPVFVDIVI